MTPTDQFHRSLLDYSDGKVRLDLEALRRAFQAVHPELAASPSARGKLRELLDRLQLDERIELPKGREQWDSSALPSLPRWVKLPREEGSVEKPDLRAIQWAPELRFLAITRVFVPLNDLLKLQEFFSHGGRARPSVPIKERSLAIFGDEKRLDQLIRGSALFGDGRLTPETLRCFIVPEPLPWSAGSNPAGSILVVENAATWHSYCRWNTERKIFSAVVYGCGNRFVDGILSLSDIFAELGGTRPVLYFGDLDPRGLLIPQEASARAEAAGLPAINPHLWSYRQLLTLGAGHIQPWEGEPPSSTLCDWLAACAEPTRQLFATGHRLAQERVGWEFLQGITGMD
jgi:Wadjet anti plasmid transformation system JetA-like protein